MKKTKSLIHATTFILLVAFWSSCTTTRTYYVQRDHIERAKPENSIPALRAEKVIGLSGNTFVKRKSVSWNANNANKRCLQNIGQLVRTQMGDLKQSCYPNSTCNTGLRCVDGTCVSNGTTGSDPEACFELEEVTSSHVKTGQTIMLAGLGIIALGMFVSAISPDRDNKMTGRLIFGTGGLIVIGLGGIITLLSTPGSPETGSPSTGFPERVGSKQGPSLGLQYHTSF